jgi:hypothetical protein
MPRGLRPTRDMVLTDFTEAGAPGAIEVLTNGQMAAFGTTARSFTSVLGGDATGFSGFADILGAGWITDAENFGGKIVWPERGSNRVMDERKEGTDAQDPCHCRRRYRSRGHQV